MTGTVKRLRADTTILLAIDVQEKLLTKIPTAPAVVRNIAFLLDVATLLDVPVRATEQYPRGLGSTSTAISTRLPQPAVAKTSFSCCGAGTFLEELRMLARHNVVLTGIETHVCIMQTALDLIEAGLTIFAPVDALAARSTVDHEAALRRMERAGVIPTSVEAVAFEWLRDSSHPQFKTVSKMIVGRSAEV